MFSERQRQIFLVAQTCISVLNDANLVVQSFYESERHLVLWFAVRDDAVPMMLDHLAAIAAYASGAMVGKSVLVGRR